MTEIPTMAQLHALRERHHHNPVVASEIATQLFEWLEVTLHEYDRLAEESETVRRVLMPLIGREVIEDKYADEVARRGIFALLINSDYPWTTEDRARIEQFINGLPRCGFLDWVSGRGCEAPVLSENDHCESHGGRMVQKPTWREVTETQPGYDSPGIVDGDLLVMWLAESLPSEWSSTAAERWAEETLARFARGGVTVLRGPESMPWEPPIQLEPKGRLTDG